MEERDNPLQEIMRVTNFVAVTEGMSRSRVSLDVHRSASEESCQSIEKCFIFCAKLQIKSRLHTISPVWIGIESEGKTSFSIRETDDIIGRELQKRGSFVR